MTSGGLRMLFLDGAMGLVVLALWVFCLIDVITTDEYLCRNLQKNWWVLIVLLLFDVGAVLWLVAGRPWQAAAARPPGPGSGGYPEYERPGRFEATRAEDDEEFLRRCRERAAQQRERYREQRRRETEGQAD